jgi:hypothetical protein
VRWWRRGSVRRVSRRSCWLYIVLTTMMNPPDGGIAGVLSTTVSVGVWIPDMIGENPPPRGGRTKRKDETSPVTC